MLRDPLYLLAALPVLGLAAAALAWGASRRRRLTARLGDEPTLARLLRPEAPARRRAQAALRLAALFFILLALAGPQWGVEVVETASANRDVVIAVDVSLSMLAEDVKPSRLERAKQELALLIDEMRGARVGVIAFAGQPVVACPLTTDSAAAKELLGSVDPGMAAVPGTAIGAAIRKGTEMLSRFGGRRTIVLLTDGEDHKSDPMGAAAAAADEGIEVDTIGIGSPEGEPIPLKGEDGRVEGYKKDKRGATVVSRLGERDLSAVAAKTGGAYFRATPGASEATDIAKRVMGGAGGEDARKGTARRYKNHFLIPLAAGFLLLLLEAALPETSAAGSAAPGAARRAAPLAALLALLLPALRPAPASAAGSESALRKGNALYEDRKYEPALEQYERAAARSPKDARPVFNAGDALYRLEQYDKAAEAFKAVADSKVAPSSRSAAYYNLGNSFYARQDYKNAVEAFRRAVALQPSDEEARRNLAVALRRLKNPPPKTKQDQKQQKKEPPKPQDQDKSGGQGQPPPQQPKTRPQDQLSKEDAQRLMRAVSERERAARRGAQKAPLKKPEAEEDW